MPSDKWWKLERTHFQSVNPTRLDSRPEINASIILDDHEKSDVRKECLSLRKDERKPCVNSGRRKVREADRSSLQIHRHSQLTQNLRSLAEDLVARVEDVLELMSVVLLGSRVSEVEAEGKELALKTTKGREDASVQTPNSVVSIRAQGRH